MDIRSRPSTSLTSKDVRKLFNLSSAKGRKSRVDPEVSRLALVTLVTLVILFSSRHQYIQLGNTQSFVGDSFSPFLLSLEKEMIMVKRKKILEDD